MIYPIIKDPQFIDIQKTRVKFILEYENGNTNIAELAVPPNQDLGINPFWDRIVQEFDIEEMRQKRNSLENKIRDDARRRREIENNRRQSENQNRIMRELFDAKVKALSLPYIENADDAVKTAIRRAPDINLLSSILNELRLDFMKTKNMNYLQYLDYLEEVEEELQLKETEQTSKLNA